MASVSSSASSSTPSASSSLAGSAAGLRAALLPTAGYHLRCRSSRLGDLKVVVLTEIEADDVLGVRLPAGHVRSIKQVPGGGVTLGAARARVGAGQPPLSG